jgi:hypothetical protein
VEGFWPIFFLAVILKIPVAALLYLVWWAIHQVPETAEGGAGNGGTRKPRHPRPPLPRRPRPRGACGLAVPRPPQRMRVVTGRSLATARAKRHTVARPAR